MTRAAPIVLLCLALTACASTNPKLTVMQLDSNDPAWAAPDCVTARQAAANFNERKGVKTAIAVAGMASGIPGAGLVVNAALSAAEEKERKRLSNAVTAACVSAPATAVAATAAETSAAATVPTTPQVEAPVAPAQ